MLKSWLKKELAGKFTEVEFDILIPPDSKLGDYSTNIAFALAKKEGKSPMEVGKSLAEEFLNNKDLTDKFEKIDLVSPGFINFTLKDEFLHQTLGKILEEKEKFGDLQLGKDPSTGSGQAINLEFVSANPTGPPTLPNARAASYGDTLGNILKKAGFKVSKEYYINDVGVQVGKLAQSIKLRMQELKGENVEFGQGLYRGEYIKDIAREFIEKNIPEALLREEAIKIMVGKAKEVMQSLGVEFDEWFPESRLHESGEVKTVFKELESKGCVVEEDGAKWLKVNDDQKAVLIKKDGSTTYLMNDIAYTKNKFERGFDKAINVWGTDHHGDVPRLKAGVAALGHDPAKLEILLHQLVMLKKKDPSTGSGQVLKISKRAGNLVLLEDLIKDVGKDAVRFFFLTKDLNTHMEFDVELAKEQSKKNPVYYIQYAFARLNSIFEKAGNMEQGAGNMGLLKEKEEIQLMRTMAKLPDIIEGIARDYQVHHLGNYA